MRPPILEMIRAKYGQPCPRVELNPENYGAANIITIATNADLSSLTSRIFDAVAEDLGAFDRELLILRVAAAVNDDEIVRLLHPEVVRAEMTEAARAAGG